MAELAGLVTERAGLDSTVRLVPYDEAYEEGFENMQRRVPDATRVREFIGVAHRHDLAAIIEAVIVEHRG